MQGTVPASELNGRMSRFRDLMDRENPDWELSVIFGAVNLFYFTGTIQDGMLLIPRGGEAEYWIRRSVDRALEESHFPVIRPMGSFRDAAKGRGAVPETVFLEAEVVPVALFRRFQKHFRCREACPLDLQVAAIRSVKSPYERSLMERAGAIHRFVLEESVPRILQEGMSEADFGSAVFSAMVREGHQGIVRFGRFNCEIVVGQIGFGASSLHPTSFDGPGGCRGICPAAPVLGSRDRLLRPGDLVFIDNACGVEGYQTDKTMTYMYGRALPDEVIAIHERCLALQDQMAALLKPGAVPSAIYHTIMDSLEPAFLEHFMGFGSRRAGFLGHGVGLQVDEMPVIAPGFDYPLQEGMAIALEPKKGIAGIGMVGTENTYLVTPSGGRSITGAARGLIPVY